MRTGVTSKVDHLGLTSSGYPSGTYFKDIQNLLEPASRVSYLRAGVTSKVDWLGLTPSGHPSGTHFGDIQDLLDLASRVSVRLRAAGLLIDIECSRVRDSSWMYLTSFVTTRIGVELAVAQGNFPTGL